MPHHEPVRVGRLRIERLAAREGEQAVGERRRALRRALRRVDVAVDVLDRGPAPMPRLQQLQAAGDAGQQIVEVVRDAAGELADRFHLLRLAQRLLGLAQALLLPQAFSDVVDCWPCWYCPIVARGREVLEAEVRTQQHVRDVGVELARQQPRPNSRTCTAPRTWSVAWRSPPGEMNPWTSVTMSGPKIVKTNQTPKPISADVAARRKTTDSSSPNASHSADVEERREEPRDEPDDLLGARHDAQPEDPEPGDDHDDREQDQADDRQAGGELAVDDVVAVDRLGEQPRQRPLGALAVDRRRTRTRGRAAAPRSRRTSRRAGTA